MVIFAGDAYKDRSPAPTFQREWGRRIIRLSQAKIPTLLLVGNHDLSPAVGPITDADRRVVGILTSRDLRFHKDDEQVISSIMTTKLVTRSPETTLEQAKD